jgi:CRISPR-associated protein Cmr5
MLTRDQKYATIIYDQVCKIKREKPEKEYTKYGAMSHKLPILIYTAGLAQALTFVDARGEQIQKQLLKDLAATVGHNDADTLLKVVREANLSSYMRLTQQILAALLWYKRFAQSILGVEASDSNNDTTSDSEVNDARPK